MQPDRHRITALAAGPEPASRRGCRSRASPTCCSSRAGTIDYNGRRITFPDVRLVYWCGGNPFHHHQDLNRLARAWQRPETVIVHESWWNPIARFADIVFPAATALERNDVAAGWADSWISAMHRAVEPPPEVCTDYETLCALAERLGFLDEFSEGRDGDEWVRHFYESTRENLRGEGVELPDYEEFWDGGPGRDADAAAAPRARLRGAARGSRGGAAADAVGPHRDRLGHDRRLRLRRLPGHPAWMEPAEWLGSRARASRFPLHLISNQPYTRLHSPVRQRRLQPGLEGRRPRADPAASRRRRARAASPTATSCASSTTAAAAWRARCSTPTCAARSSSSPPAPGGIPSRRAIPAALDRHGNPNVLTLDKGTSRLAQGPSAQTALVELERFDGGRPRCRRSAPATAGEVTMGVVDGMARWTADPGTGPPLRAQTTGDLLDAAAQRWPARDAVVAPPARWSFAALRERARGAGRALIASGIGPGDRVAVWATNLPDWIALQFGAAYSGAVLVPLNPLYRLTEASDVLARSGASALFVLPEHRGASLWDLAFEATEDVPVVAFGDAPDARGAGYEDWIATGESVPDAELFARSAAVAASDPVQIQFTSGTTGAPKGVVLSHGGLVNNARLCWHRAGLRRPVRFCSALPFFHCGGSAMSTLGAIATGSAFFPQRSRSTLRAWSPRSRRRASRRSWRCRRCSSRSSGRSDDRAATG